MRLGPKSGRFWLVVIIAIGIVCVGGRFSAVAAAGAEGFGVPVPRSDAYAYVAVKGTQAIVSALLLATGLTMSDQRRVVGAFILVAALIPAGDVFTVVAYVGKAAITPLLIDGCTAIDMVVVGILLLKPISFVDSK